MLKFSLIIAGVFAFVSTAPRVASQVRPFAVTVVDEQTGRGVPLVELKTVNDIIYVTDSAGVAAIDEPGLMGRSVFFQLKSHGYDFPKDGFGISGKALDVVEGGASTLKIQRRNIAERLYRITGGGIYRDSVLTGKPVPIKSPLLNAQVLGSDSVLMIPFRGKLHWFWGDTNRPGYPLGNFHTPGAASLPPGQGGLDPELGVDLTYYVDPSGFAKPTAKLPGEGPTWLFGLAGFRDTSGQERLVATYSKIKPPMETYEQGLVAFNPESAVFDKVVSFPRDAAVRTSGHTFLQDVNGLTFVYYSTPFPITRVRARMTDLSDITRYETFTCLTQGSRLDKPEVDRGPDGRARYSWKENTSAVDPGVQSKLIRSGALKEDEGLFALRDAETGKPVTAHNGSTYWNPYRKRWIAIFSEIFGTSMLGETWYAEADTPLGPWVYARKIVSHDKYSFYNPKYHPPFDKDGGRVIFFEGTYTVSFSGNPNPTPRYDYNQIMYKLDLSDPRLNLPAPVYEVGGHYATGADAARRALGAPAVFFALERAGEGTVPIVSTAEGLRSATPNDPEKPAFFGLSTTLKSPPSPTVLLENMRGGKAENFPKARVWPAPTRVRLPGLNP